MKDQAFQLTIPLQLLISVLQESVCIACPGLAAEDGPQLTCQALSLGEENLWV